MKLIGTKIRLIGPQMSLREPSQNQKLKINLFLTFKPLYLEFHNSDFTFVGVYPHYIGYPLPCVQVSAKSNHKRML